MLETFLSVPLHFTIEFLGFVVMGGGAFLVLSRPGLIPGGGGHRVVAAFGLALLAIAQVLHGGSYIESDAGTVLVALHGVGYALVLAALIRPGKAAVAAAAPASPVAPAVAAVAFGLAVAALVRALRDRLRPLLRLAVAALLLGVSDVLTARIETIAGSGIPDSYLVASHAVRTGGYLVLGSWLWTGVRSSIRVRFVAYFVALLVTVVLALSTALTGVISENVEAAELDRVLEQAENVAANLQGEDTQDLLTQVKAGRALVEETLLTPGADLRSTAQQILAFDLFEIDFMILRARGGDLGWAGRGPAETRPNGRPRSTRLTGPFVVKVLGSPVTGEVLGPAPELASLDVIDDAVVMMAMTDVVTEAGRELGTLIFGRHIDAFEIEDISNALRPARATLVVDGEVVATELRQARGRDFIPRDVRSDLQTTGAGRSQVVTIGRRSFFSGFVPLTRPDGVTVGTLVLSSPASVVAEARGGVTRALFLVAMGVGAVALLLAWLSGRRISQPLQDLTATARRVREGDLHAEVQVSGVDEVGQLGETFNEMTISLLTMTNDLREAAREEHRLRARIETIIQSMADGLIAVDASGSVLAFNRQAEALTGIKTRSALGRPIRSILDVRDQQGEQVPLPVFDVAAGSVSGVQLHRREGPQVPVAITSAVLRAEDGSVAGAVAVIRDMTREREVERMKSEFLSNISHELRTPLTPIKGYAEILSRKKLPAEKAKQFVQGILSSTERLERIVELLVDFAAMEAGRLAPRSTVIDMGDMVRRLAQEWEERTPRHEIVTDVRARLPKVVGDERLLRRSLEEIIDNAVKFSPDGGRILLQARGVAANGVPRRGVAVTVADEGIGITPEDVEKIFSDFQQLDGSETRSYGGLGLGLSFVQRIIHAHHGSISVDSAPAAGTRFTITIPAGTGPPRGKVTRAPRRRK